MKGKMCRDIIRISKTMTLKWKVVYYQVSKTYHKTTCGVFRLVLASAINFIFASSIRNVL